jgi:transposase
MLVSTFHWKARACALPTRQGGSSAGPRWPASRDVLIGWFRGLEFAATRIGLEAGPLSQWLYAGMRAAGLSVELLQTRHVRNAFNAMPIMTDRKDGA